jgi:hypothetical protein
MALVTFSLRRLGMQSPSVHIGSAGAPGGVGLQIATPRHRRGSLQHAVRNVDTYDLLRRVSNSCASAGR